MLNYKYEKQKTFNTQGKTTDSESGQYQSDAETPKKIKNNLTEEIESSGTNGMARGGQGQGYTGIERLKKTKKEMEIFYKDLIKVLFMDQINKEQAIAMERKVNMLIMSINDQIDEIEIRQRKDS